MNKEIGKLEWDCQIITKDGKYFGYGDNEVTLLMAILIIWNTPPFFKCANP
jgi:hypothetical protein